MSVKANTRITKEAQEEIINKLRKCNNPYNCPHGRPTIIHFTIYEIEKCLKEVFKVLQSLRSLSCYRKPKVFL